MPLIDLLVLVVVLVLICIVTKWFVGYMGVPHPISLIITVAVGLICLLVFLNAAGVMGHGPVIRFR